MTTSLPTLEYKTASVRSLDGTQPVAAVFGPVDGTRAQWQSKGAADPKFDLTGEPDGTVWAVVAVTGVRDDVNDVIVPGAFGRSLREREMKGVLGHDWNRPVAVQREAMELLPGDPRLPSTLADGTTPWPREAGALLVKAQYILGTTDGHDAYVQAQAFEKTHAYSIGYKVAKAREKAGVRYIYDLDVYEFSPVLHGANRLATLQAVKSAQPLDLETTQRWVDLPEEKARNLVRRVIDAAYWGRPVGTIITPGMKPSGPRARAGARDRGGNLRPGASGQRGVGGGMGRAGLGGLRRDTAAAVRARSAALGSGDTDYGQARKLTKPVRAAVLADDREGLRKLIDTHGRRTVEYAANFYDYGSSEEEARAALAKLKPMVREVEDQRDAELGVQRRDGESRAAARARHTSTGDVTTARANLLALVEAEQAKTDYDAARYNKINNWETFANEERALVASEDGRVAAMHRGLTDKGVDQGWAVVDTRTGRILAKQESDEDVHEFVESAAEAAADRDERDRDGRAGGDGREALADESAAGVRGDTGGQAGGVLPRSGDAGGRADTGDGRRAGGAGQDRGELPGSGGAADRGGSDRTGGSDQGADSAGADTRLAGDGGGVGRDGDRTGGPGGRGDGGVREGRGGVLDGEGIPDELDAGEDHVDGEVTAEDLAQVDTQTARGLANVPRDAESFTPTGVDDLAPAGVKAKLDANLAALRVLRHLQRPSASQGVGTPGMPGYKIVDEYRAATPEEQAILAKWAGWGGLPKVFEESDPTYAKEREELRGLLSESEWNEGRKNTLNAHYTDARAVAAVWDAVKALGGGNPGDRILEPGSGSGNFIGFAPEGVDMVGVELDSTTAAISKYLYPQAKIRNESFADTRVPDGAFDGVVGNVPFGRFSLFDPVHNPDGESIHNHFINKSLALTRPGGIVAVLTSRYTMDSEDSSARERMAEMGDLIGAVRLPSGSHRRASGTDVIEDILIFRKREKGAPPQTSQAWVRSGKVPLPGDTSGRSAATLNPYWERNPSHVLGRIDVVRGQYGADIRVRGDRDQVNMATLPAVLDEIVADARRQDVMATPRDPDTDLPELIDPDTSRTEGHIQVENDGSFTQAIGGAAVKIEIPKAQAKELAALFGIRDDLQDLLRLEARAAEDTPEIAAARAKLNASYDDYVRRYGPVNRYELNKAGGRKPRPVAAAFRKDPTSALVRALETYDPTGNDGKGSATKSAIFTKRAAAPRTLNTTADNPADALALSLDTFGEVRLPEIARMLGTDEATARVRLGDLVQEIPPLTFEEEEAAWDAERLHRAGRDETPLSPDDEPEALRAVADSVREIRGELVSRAEYLSGNVRRKLAIAKAAARHDRRFNANVAALEAVIPRELGTDEIDARLGAAWIPASDVEAFANELMGTSGYGRDKVTVSNIKNVWRVEGDRAKNGVLANSTWGTEGRAFGPLLQGILEQRPIKITIKDDPQASADATLAAQAKGEELQERFREWIWEDADRARRLVSTYNDQFNNLALRDYGGTTRTFPGMAAGFKPRPHQVAAVERIVNEPTALLGHVVGAGKTAEMVLGAAELKRLGMARKPAIVVPNHMLEQFEREYLEIYPDAKILAAGTDDLAGDKRREFVARAATGDWDVVILTQEAFNAIPMSREQQKAYVASQVAEMRAALQAAKDAGKDEDDKTVKEMEKQIQAAETALDKLLAKAGKDEGAVTFEETGIDYLFVDEAHHYSNLRTVSRTQGTGATGSGKATDLHMKLEYLRATTNSGRVATFATGTPIRNTVTQAYIMMKFLRPDLLQEANVDSFDSWAATFGEVVEEMELKPEGSGFRQTSRFAKFRNVPELLRIFHTFADIKLAEDLKLPTPNLVGGRAETITVAPSEELRQYIRELGQRAEEVRNGAVEPDEDNMLKISTDGRKAALSMALVGQDHQPGKVESAADNIHTIWEQTRDNVYPIDPRDPDAGDDPQRGGLQIVFLDLGTPKSAADIKKLDAAGETHYDAYDALREELVARGMDRKRIRFMHEARNDAEKAELFAAARSGRIDVLIGSTEKMGVGTNVQRRAVALHHLDAPWRPADVEQREGRIVRQGNLNRDVRILRYVTEGSFDGYMWQTLERKAKFINQIMKGSLDVREIEDVGDTAMSYAEVKALATGNLDLLAKAKVDALRVKLERLNRTHNRTQTNLRTDVGKFTAEAEYAEAGAEKVTAALARRVDTRGDKFRMEFDDAIYSDRTTAAEALRDKLDPLFGELRRAWREEDRRRKVATVGGLDLYARYDDSGVTGGRLVLEFEDLPGFVVSGTRGDLLGVTGTGHILRIENYLSNLEGARAGLLARAEDRRREVERMVPRIGQEFGRLRELRAAQAKSERLRIKMLRDAARASSPGLGPNWTREQLDAMPPYKPNPELDLTPEQVLLQDLSWHPEIDTDEADDPILGRDEASVTGPDLAEAQRAPAVAPTVETAPETPSPREVTSPAGEVADRVPPPAEPAGIDADTLDTARADADAALTDGDVPALAGALGRMGVPREDGRDELAAALVALPDDVQRRRLDQIETINAADDAQAAVLANQRRRVIEAVPADVEPEPEPVSEAAAAVPTFAAFSDLTRYIAAAGDRPPGDVSRFLRNVIGADNVPLTGRQLAMARAASAGRARSSARDFDLDRARAALQRLADDDPTLPANALGRHVVLEERDPTDDTIRIRNGAAEPARRRQVTGTVVEVNRGFGGHGVQLVIDRDHPEREGSPRATQDVEADAVLTLVDPDGAPTATIPAADLAEADTLEAPAEQRAPRLGLTARDAYGKPWQQGYESAWMRLQQWAGGRGVNGELALADYDDADLAEALNLVSRNRAQIRYSAGGGGQGEKRSYDRLEATIRAEQRRRQEQGPDTAEAPGQPATPPVPTTDAVGPTPAVSGPVPPRADELSTGTFRSLGIRPGDRAAVELDGHVLVGTVEGTPSFLRLRVGGDPQVHAVGGTATVVRAAKLDEQGRIVSPAAAAEAEKGKYPTPESSRARTNRLNRAAENAGGRGGSSSRRVLHGSVHYVSAPDTPEGIARVQTAIRALGWGGVGMSLGISSVNREDRSGPNLRSIEVRVPDTGPDGTPLRTFGDGENVVNAPSAEAPAAAPATPSTPGVPGVQSTPAGPSDTPEGLAALYGLQLRDYPNYPGVRSLVGNDGFGGSVHTVFVDADGRFWTGLPDQQYSVEIPPEDVTAYTARRINSASMGAPMRARVVESLRAAREAAAGPDMGDVANHERPAELVAEDRARADGAARARDLVRQAREASQGGDDVRAVELIGQAQQADPARAPRLRELADNYRNRATRNGPTPELGMAELDDEALAGSMQVRIRMLDRLMRGGADQDDPRVVRLRDEILERRTEQVRREEDQAARDRAEAAAGEVDPDAVPEEEAPPPVPDDQLGLFGGQGEQATIPAADLAEAAALTDAEFGAQAGVGIDGQQVQRAQMALAQSNRSDLADALRELGHAPDAQAADDLAGELITLDFRDRDAANARLDAILRGDGGTPGGPTEPEPDGNQLAAQAYQAYHLDHDAAAALAILERAQQVDPAQSDRWERLRREYGGVRTDTPAAPAERPQDPYSVRGTYTVDGRTFVEGVEQSDVPGVPRHVLVGGTPRLVVGEDDEGQIIAQQIGGGRITVPRDAVQVYDVSKANRMNLSLTDTQYTELTVRIHDLQTGNVAEDDSMGAYVNGAGQGIVIHDLPAFVGELDNALDLIGDNLADGGGDRTERARYQAQRRSLQSLREKVLTLGRRHLVALPEAQHAVPARDVPEAPVPTPEAVPTPQAGPTPDLVPGGEPEFPVGASVLPVSAVQAFGGHPDLTPGRVSEVHPDGTVTVAWTPHITSTVRPDELVAAPARRTPEPPAATAPVATPSAGEPIEVALDGPMLAPDQLNIADAPGITVAGRRGTVTDPDSLRDWLDQRAQESARGGAAVKRRRAAARLLRALDDHLADREDDQAGPGGQAAPDTTPAAPAAPEPEGTDAGAEDLFTGTESPEPTDQGEPSQADQDGAPRAPEPTAADQDGAPAPDETAPEGAPAGGEPSQADQGGGVPIDDVTEGDGAEIAPAEAAALGADVAGPAPDEGPGLADQPDGAAQAEAEQAAADQGEQEILPADLVEEARAVEADALGLIEAEDGELEVTPDVYEREQRVEKALNDREAGRLDVHALGDTELAEGRRDAVDELRLQEALARRERDRRREARQAQAQALAAQQAALQQAQDLAPDAGAAPEGEVPEAAPPVPEVPAEPPAPKRRPGLAGAVEDWADAIEGGDPAAVEAGAARVRTSLARSHGDSQQHRDLAAELDKVTAGEVVDPAKLRELATALRENARKARNESAKRRRLVKRLERERLRALIAEYDAELRNRGRNPEDFGGRLPEPVDIGEEAGPVGPDGQPLAGGEAGPGATPGGAGAGQSTGPGPEPAAQGSETPAPPRQTMPTFDRADPDGPAGQARTTELVDGLVGQPWRLLGAGVVTSNTDPGQEPRREAARAALAPVLDEFGPAVRRRTNEDHDVAARMARANLRRRKGGGNVDAAAATFALLLPKTQRPAFVAAMRGAIGEFKKKLGAGQAGG